MLVFADGRTVGTIGGGCYENEACLKAREVLESGRQVLLHFELNDDFAQENGLICGGQMDVHVDPLEPAPRLYIIGAGHVGWHLARAAGEIDFRVHVVDDREKFASRERFPAAEEIVVEPIAEWLHRADIPARPTSSSSRAGIRATSKPCGRSPRAICGTSGSSAAAPKSRASAVRSSKRACRAECLDRVHSPIGLEIGAVTPAEIAVSILAELIAVRRGVPTGVRRASRKVSGSES